MKKIVIAAILCTVMAAMAFAFDVSFGIGPVFGYSASKSEANLKTTVSYPTAMLPPLGIPLPPFIDLDGTGTMGYKTSSFDVGFLAFVDCTYAELSAGYLAQTGKTTDIKGELKLSHAMIGELPAQDLSSKDKDYSSHLVVVNLLGKYPFRLNEKLTVFPAAGVGLKFPVAGDDADSKVTWGVNLRAGGGVDYALTERLYLRGELLFFYQIASDTEAEKTQDGIKLKLDFKKDASFYYMGPQLVIAVGYKIPLGGGASVPAESEE